ncbi:MAG: hypothetical protein AB1439_04150 [candidate division FCPU426 bacterium]
MPKRLLFPLIAILSFAGSGFAADLEVTSLNIHAQSLGAGAATEAWEEYPSSRNPAALGLLRTSSPVQIEGNTSSAQARECSLLLSQARLRYDAYAYQILFTSPLFGGGLGVRFDQLITQNQTYQRLLFNPDGTPVIDPLTNQQAWELKYDTRVDSAWGLAWGAPLEGGMSVGAEAQVIYLHLGEDFAWGWDGVVGLRWQVLPELAVAASARQVSGGWHAWRKPYAEETGRPLVSLGCAWQPPELPLRIGGGVSRRLDQSDRLRGRLGAEYTIYGPLTLRAGWDADHANLGASFTWEAVTVDYAAILGGVLYDANRITVKVEF